MDRKEEILLKLNAGKKSYFRGGNVLKNILSKSKQMVSGDDALLVFNTYGIEPRLLNLLFLSHGLDMNEERFVELLLEQEERCKNSKCC